jgi:hypothetical protein
VVYRGHVVEALRELADPAERSRLWLSSGGEASSIVECTCRLFDDSGLGDALDRGEPVFSERIDRELQLLRKVLASIDVGRDPTELLADPSVSEAGVRAGGVLAALGPLR